MTEDDEINLGFEYAIQGDNYHSKLIESMEKEEFDNSKRRTLSNLFSWFWKGFKSGYELFYNMFTIIIAIGIFLTSYKIVLEISEKLKLVIHNSNEFRQETLNIIYILGAYGIAVLLTFSYLKIINFKK